MVRTQLYLPEDSYKTIKEKASAKKMTFASYVRVLIDKDILEAKKKKTIHEQFPFIGMFKAGKDISADNNEIDKVVYDL